MNREKKLILFVGAALLIIFVADWMQPRPVNWSQSYSSRDTIPYGASGLYRVMPELFSESEVNTIDVPAYDWLIERNEDDDRHSLLFFLNNNLIFDEFETSLLLEFAEGGGTVFMSAEQYSGPLKDTLRIGIDEGVLSGLGVTGIDMFGDFGQADSTGISVNPASLRAAQPVYRYPSFLTASIFTAFDTLNTKVLGFNDLGEPNFIQVKHGDGLMYLHTVPAALTNYFLVDRDREGYIWEVLSLLPERTVYWDEYKKVMTAEARTPLRYILSIDTLRYGLYLGLFTLCLFIIFNAKRRQAVIPVHERPANATIDFVKTVTNLFFSGADHKDLAERRIICLYDYFRRVLGLDQVPGEAITPQLVAARSGVAEGQIEDLFAGISAVREKSFIGANELKSLNTKIETFYNTTQR